MKSNICLLIVPWCYIINGFKQPYLNAYSLHIKIYKHFMFSEVNVNNQIFKKKKKHLPISVLLKQLFITEVIRFSRTIDSDYLLKLFTWQYRYLEQLTYGLSKFYVLFLQVVSRYNLLEYKRNH